MEDHFTDTENKSLIAILNEIYKPYKDKGSGTSNKDEHARKEAEDNRNEQLEAEKAFHPPEIRERKKSFHPPEFRECKTASRQATSPTHWTFEENVERLAAYKDMYGDCHVPQRYTDDQTLATWVMNV